MTFIPTLSNPRAGAPDIPAIHFLRDNLGMNRFYTLGPIQPNYGAYFPGRLDQPQLSARQQPLGRLDSGKPGQRRECCSLQRQHPRPKEDPSQAEELRRNLVNYQWIGVKYVVAAPNQRSLLRHRRCPARLRGHGDEHFRATASQPILRVGRRAGRISIDDRAHLTAECSAPDRLVRRELFFPGWVASTSGGPLPIVEHGGLSRRSTLPAGRSELRFSYAPPHVEWAWLAAFAGLIVLPLPTLRRALRSARRSRSAT